MYKLKFKFEALSEGSGEDKLVLFELMNRCLQPEPLGLVGSLGYGTSHSRKASESTI